MTASVRWTRDGINARHHALGKITLAQFGSLTRVAHLFANADRQRGRRAR